MLIALIHSAIVHWPGCRVVLHNPVPFHFHQRIPLFPAPLPRIR